ncbi:MAG TPA: beta-ketoacyl synthase N-terminal-like domain-containing protein [Candidatus Limnocylindria bacterium]|jgi:malonyl-ACP decarboxylase|nr:beta-ketoacyl synthase N-terminal-like domain-containing protein [Candidatus Limnocylindria bacterium]
MTRNSQPRVALSGLGVVSAAGIGLQDFREALQSGRSGIAAVSGGLLPAAALLAEFSWADWLESVRPLDTNIYLRARKILHNAPDSVRYSARAAIQAYFDAGLHEQRIPAEDIGLVVAGSNLHQRFVAENAAKFGQRPESINPRYALNFWDTHQVGCLSEILGIKGMSYTVGGASAGGNVGLHQGAAWIRSGMLRGCLVVGASSDFSPLEFQAFSILGAIDVTVKPEMASSACRPFDRGHSGFVWGQGSGAAFLESFESAALRAVTIHAELAGSAVTMDANHLSNPNREGEIRAMRMALEAAGMAPEEMDYVNAHGTSTPLGDQVECEAIRELFQGRAAEVWINSTKSFTGHCMAASSVIELVAVALQMKHAFLHANLNLDEPIADGLRFVGKEAVPVKVRCALSNAFGFGGFNTSLAIRHVE